MINDLRYDFGYALIEEYKTYWDGFQTPDEPYSLLMNLHEDILMHFKNRKQHAMAIRGVTERLLLDQNTFWFITYAKTLKGLSCIDDIHEDNISIICKKNRWIHSRKIICLKDNNNVVDPLDP